MEDVRKFSGTGNFFLPRAPKNGKIYIGEANGFQDYLFGFGMRYAMKSGYCAAKSIIEGENFYKLCQKDIIPRMKASVVNRLVFSLFGKTAYKWLVKNCSEKDPAKFIRESYKYGLFQKALFPFAAVVLRKNIKDPRSL